ncbi:TIR domain-containing protein [Paracidovorax valerianellae]|uniref:Tetratricopeptide repeat-containing protein n=1 Tax=Paracidovorax valerianellae TaxID=187868 RepID=A0A1G7C5V1_9BURK|nr:TIR domain-containing protein [Paracidovorax valerianellae]MDA8446560.1 nucleotide-binding protein [Paracidovorax valerianellae]SDE34688.1 Tetratricopeptide repeat-containing protein [Paracidovorax valerianellae]
MKSRIFIGSSVEGLSIAYAIQQNLLHDAETTVWDQGVFELSGTTIASLTKTLSESDFGIFVFSPDDVVKIREKESPSVRDNVLFEMGLFIGRLGKDRVFFILPKGADIHIPSDLLGITPGLYDPNRSDGSMQAATGPVSHQIRLQIKTLGPLNAEKTAPSEPQESKEPDEKPTQWIYDFLDKRYDIAIKKLKESVGTEDGMSQDKTEAWIAYCEFKKNQTTGLSQISEVSKKFPIAVEAQALIASFLRNEKLTDKATELLESLPTEVKDHPAIRVALAECHASNEDDEKAIELLSKSDPQLNPDVALFLANLQEEKDDKTGAFKTVASSYANHQRHIELRYKLARLAMDEDHNEIALFLLDELSKEHPKSSDYHGYFGNCCVALDLLDQAMQAYKKAEEAAPESGRSWIISNIGNIYFAKGLPSEAIKHFDRSIESYKSSEYAHDRLSRSIKMKEEEQKSMSKKIKEGLQKLRHLCKETSSATEV